MESGIIEVVETIGLSTWEIMGSLGAENTDIQNIVVTTQRNKNDLQHFKDIDEIRRLNTI
jgi:hypothetical protein